MELLGRSTRKGDHIVRMTWHEYHTLTVLKRKMKVKGTNWPAMFDYIAALTDDVVQRRMACILCQRPRTYQVWQSDGALCPPCKDAMEDMNELYTRTDLLEERAELVRQKMRMQIENARTWRDTQGIKEPNTSV